MVIAVNVKTVVGVVVGVAVAVVVYGVHRR